MSEAIRSRRRDRGSWIVILLATVVIGAAFYGQLRIYRSLRTELARARLAADAGAFTPGSEVPVATLRFEGARESLAVHLQAGGVVAVFTSDCPFCAESVPVWNELSTQLRDAAIPFVPISLHDPERSRAFEERLDTDWHAATLTSASSTSTLGVRAVPLVAVVGPDGIVHRRWEGVVRPARLAEIVARAQKALVAAGDDVGRQVPEER